MKIAIAIVWCVVSMCVCESVRFESADPLQLIETDFRAEKGIIELHLSIKFDNPCEVDNKTDWTSVYNIKWTAYNKLHDLCQADYNLVLKTLRELATFLPKSRNRDKRIVPFVLGGAALVVTAGGTASYRYLAYNSDYNRLNRIEDRENYVNKSISDLKEKFEKESERLQGLITLGNTTNEKTQDNKNGVIQLATMTADVSWTSSKIANRLHSYRDGLGMIQSQCSRRRLSMEGLNKIKQIKELGPILDDDTWVSEIQILADDTISIVVNINVARTNTFVYEVVAIDHWANYTFKPTYVTYQGPKYVLHDEDFQCTKGISKPRQRSIYDICTSQHYVDPKMKHWTPISATDREIEQKSQPVVLKIGRKNVIYCFYHNITIDGLNEFCPATPFTLSQSTSFNLTGMNYTVDIQYMDRQTVTQKIVTPILGNVTDEGYANTHLAFLNLKKAQEQAGLFWYQDGVINLPIQHLSGGLLGILASFITIWQCFVRYFTKPAAGQSSVTERDEHQEQHSEIINVNINQPKSDDSKAVTSSTGIEPQLMIPTAPPMVSHNDYMMIKKFQDFQMFRQLQHADAISVPLPPPKRLPLKPGHYECGLPLPARK